MNDARIRRALTEIAAEGVPAGGSFWPRLESALQAGGHVPVTPAGSTGSLRHRMQSLPAALILVLLLSTALVGGGYAALPLIQQVLNRTPEGQQMLQYGETMHLTHSVNGVTVTLTFAYADQAGGLLGVTITGPGRRAFMPVMDHVRLTSGKGIRLQITAASGTGLQGGSAGSFLGFGGQGDESRHGRVSLHLTIEAVMSDGTSGHVVRGPWVFDFTAPVALTRFVQPRQTVVADGWPVTLESITVTPPGAWVTLRGASPDASVELTAAGRTYHLYQEGFAGSLAIKTCFADHQWCPNLWKDRDVTYAAVAMEPAGLDGRGLQEDTATTARWLKELQTAGGEWTITVRPDPAYANPMFALRGGPWVFHATVPEGSASS